MIFTIGMVGMVKFNETDFADCDLRKISFNKLQGRVNMKSLGDVIIWAG